MHISVRTYITCMAKNVQIHFVNFFFSLYTIKCIENQAKCVMNTKYKWLRTKWRRNWIIENTKRKYTVKVWRRRENKKNAIQKMNINSFFLSRLFVAMLNEIALYPLSLTKRKKKQLSYLRRKWVCDTLTPLTRITIETEISIVWNNRHIEKTMTNCQCDKSRDDDDNNNDGGGGRFSRIDKNILHHF